MTGVDYASGAVPPDYRCGKCGAHGCKLWRIPGEPSLLCVGCVEDAAGERLDTGRGVVCQIGSYVPAIPDEKGGGFWGSETVPRAGVAWWKALPMAQPATDADIAREFFRRFGPVKVLVAGPSRTAGMVEHDGERWISGVPTVYPSAEKHAAGEDGFVAALERARELVRKGDGR